MLETILILNATALLTNTTIILVVIYKTMVKVYRHETKRP
jgi:hypothetical protein